MSEMDSQTQSTHTHTGLRYRWGSHDPQDSPAPPRDTQLSILIGPSRRKHRPVELVTTAEPGERWDAYLDGPLKVVATGHPPEEKWIHPDPITSYNATPQLQAWARWCALQVVHLWDCPEVVRRYLETGEENLKQFASNEAADAHRQLRGYDSGDPIGAAMWAAAPSRFEVSKAATRTFCEVLASPVGWGGRGIRDERRSRMQTHLRTLLPPSHQALLDPQHEPVLIDYLLTNRPTRSVGRG